MRDDFNEGVKRIVAARVSYVCSNPDCETATTGPRVDPSKSLNIGVASHISAASPGGPRYNERLTPKERTCHQNAIWLCQNCAKLVDNDEQRFTERVLIEWKRNAEARALLRIGRTAKQTDPDQERFSDEELVILQNCAVKGDIVLLVSDEFGQLISINGNWHYDPADYSLAALYVDALFSLCQRGLVRHQEDNLYNLTGRGFRVARAISRPPA